MTRREDIEAALRRIAPKIPRHEFAAIADHAMDSPGLRRAAPEPAAWLSLVAYVRHVLTDYDELLEQGYDPESARHFVLPDMEETLADWGVRRPISASGE
jgi:hypothetical protein